MASFKPLVLVVLMMVLGVALITAQAIQHIDCTKHSECPDHLTCFRNLTCQDLCFFETSPDLECGPNAKCIVRNHLPGCACLPGFEGNDAKLLGCVTSVTGSREDYKEVSWEVPGEDSGEDSYYPNDSAENFKKEGEGGCKAQSQCPDNLACFSDGICRDACIHTAHGLQCGRFEVCRVINHWPVCQAVRQGILFGRRN